MASDDDILIVSGGFQMDASQSSIAENAAQFDDSIDNSKDLLYNATHGSTFGSGAEVQHVGAGEQLQSKLFLCSTQSQTAFCQNAAYFCVLSSW